MTSLERLAVRAAVFLGGAMLMALEVAAFRIIGKTFGSALRETTAVIAVFLAAMSIGYWVGGRMGDRWPRSSTLVAVLSSAAATLLCVPYLDALLAHRIAASQLDLATHAFIATTLLFSVPAFLFASISPIAIRLFATTTGHIGSTAGSISAISTFGSIAGSVITAFFLIDWLASIARTVLFVSLGACLTAVALLLSSLTAPALRSGFRRYGVIAGVAVILIVIPAAAFLQSTRLDRSLLRPTAGAHVLFVGDSAYHRITVYERGNLRELTFNIGVQTRMNNNDPFGAGSAYVDGMHIGRLMRPTLRRVLVIGLGGGTAPKQFARFYDDTTIDAVEVDPLVVDVAMKFFHVLPSQRLRIHIGDGRTFLRQSREKWDLIIIDVATTNRYGNTLPPHLVTAEFFREAAGHLNEAGILHFHCPFGDTKLLPALQKTAATVFESVLVTRSEILASDIALITPKEVIAERAKSSPVANLPHLMDHITDLRPNPPAGPDVIVLTDDFAPVDTLIRAKR